MEKIIEQVRYPKGSTIWVEESPNPGYIYVMREGLAGVQADLNFEEERLNFYHPGDAFGLVSALTRTPHRQTLHALKECHVVRVPVDRLGDYLRGHPEACLKIIAMYARQLRLMDHHLEDDESESRSPWRDKPEKMYADAREYTRHGFHELALYTHACFLKWSSKVQMNELLVAEARKSLDELDPDYEMPVRTGTTLELKDGEIIFVENEPDDGHFYVVKSGSVKVTRLVNGKEYILNILGPGEIFGEMAVVNHKVRSATTIAREDCTLMRLTGENFLDAVGGPIIQKLFSIIARRIWQSYQRIYLKQFDDPNAKLYIYLQIRLLDTPRDDEDNLYKLDFALEDLKKMAGMSDLDDGEIRLFLGDQNIVITDASIQVRNATVIGDKVKIYKNNLKRKRGRVSI